MNQTWLIDHVLDRLGSYPESPPQGRAFLTMEQAERIVDETLDHLGETGEETEYTYMRGHRKRLINALTMIPLADEEHTSLLDIGCYGYMAYWARRHLGYERVVGIEWHPESDEPLIRRTLRVNDDEIVLESHNFDITRTEWPIDERFDTVLFFEVLEHINTDPMGVMERINACMHEGGTLVMSVPNAVSYKTLREFIVGMPPWTYWFYEPDLTHEPRHCFEYTPIVFHSLLTASGMRIEAFRTIYAYSSPESEHAVVRVAESLGLDAATFGETMIATTTKVREGVPLRYPDVLYSPDGYYKNIYPCLQGVLQKRLATHESLTHNSVSIIEAKPDPNTEQASEAEPWTDAAQRETLQRRVAELTEGHDTQQTLAITLSERCAELETQVRELLYQSDCAMQREQELREQAQAAEASACEAHADRERLAQENAELRAQVDELLFACDCYLQQINDPARCVQVIRQRRFRRALERAKSIARKTPVAKTLLRPVYRNAKRIIKRRM